MLRHRCKEEAPIFEMVIDLTMKKKLPSVRKDVLLFFEELNINEK